MIAGLKVWTDLFKRGVKDERRLKRVLKKV